MYIFTIKSLSINNHSFFSGLLKWNYRYYIKQCNQLLLFIFLQMPGDYLKPITENCILNNPIWMHNERLRKHFNQISRGHYTKLRSLFWPKLHFTYPIEKTQLATSRLATLLSQKKQPQLKKCSVTWHPRSITIPLSSSLTRASHLFFFYFVPSLDFLFEYPLFVRKSFVLLFKLSPTHIKIPDSLALPLPPSLSILVAYFNVYLKKSRW